MRDTAPPGEALRRWVGANVEFVATKKGMAAALALAAYNKDLTRLFVRPAEPSARRICSIARGRRANCAPRSRPQELMRALIGFCMVDKEPGWRETASRLIDVFMDGLLIEPR